jgi:hypothetical protein
VEPGTEKIGWLKESARGVEHNQLLKTSLRNVHRTANQPCVRVNLLHWISEKVENGSAKGSDLLCATERNFGRDYMSNLLLGFQALDK